RTTAHANAQTATSSTRCIGATRRARLRANERSFGGGDAAFRHGRLCAAGPDRPQRKPPAGGVPTDRSDAAGAWHGLGGDRLSRASVDDVLPTMGAERPG